MSSGHRDRAGAQAMFVLVERHHTIYLRLTASIEVGSQSYCRHQYAVDIKIANHISTNFEAAIQCAMNE